MKQDMIEIKDLLVRGVVGLNEDERRKRQDILVNLAPFGSPGWWE